MVQIPPPLFLFTEELKFQLNILQSTYSFIRSKILKAMKTKKVSISGSAFYNMVRSTIEVWPTESTGLIYGFKSRDRYILTNACSVQTAIRNPTNVKYGNGAAVMRITNLERAISETGESESGLVGGFHTHPVHNKKSDPLLDPSEGDLEFIEDEMRRFGLDYWFEIIIKIKKRDYSHRSKLSVSSKKLSVSSKNCPRKLVLAAKIENYSGYRLTLAGFYVDQNLIPEEVILRRTKPIVTSRRTIM